MQILACKAFKKVETTLLVPLKDTIMPVEKNNVDKIKISAKAFSVSIVGNIVETLYRSATVLSTFFQQVQNKIKIM